MYTAITGKCSQCLVRTQGKFNGSFMCRKCQTNSDIEKRTRHLMSLDKIDFGWLAGLIEGEGCFYCKESNSKLKNGSYCYPLPGFTLMSTDEDIMIRASKLLELPLNGPYYKSAKNDRKIVWSIQVTGYKAMVIMKIFYNYLGNRRKEQINKSLSWQSQGKFVKII